MVEALAIKVPVDPLYLQIASALERKGQVILYGPPGTGKTYSARRFAVWWLLRQAGESMADNVLTDASRMAQWSGQLGHRLIQPTDSAEELGN